MMTEAEVINRVARMYGVRKYLVVPNVLNPLDYLYEADMVVINPNRFATEIEVKVSLSDFKADFKKKFQHDHRKITYFSFAVPAELESKVRGLLPPGTGLIVAHPELRLAYQRIRPKARENKHRWTDTEMYELARLGTLRYWSLRFAVEPEISTQ